MPKDKYRRCPHCKKDIRAGNDYSAFKSHLAGCAGSFGIKTADRKFWGKDLKKVEGELNQVKPLEEAKEHFRIT